MWASLLVAAQAADAMTTAVDQARGTIESMGVTATLLGVGGFGFLLFVKLLVAAGAGAALSLLAVRIKPEVSASSVTFRLALIAVQAATLGVVWVSLSNVAVLSSLES